MLCEKMQTRRNLGEGFVVGNFWKGSTGWPLHKLVLSLPGTIIYRFSDRPHHIGICGASDKVGFSLSSLIHFSRNIKSTAVELPPRYSVILSARSSWTQFAQVQVLTALQFRFSLTHSEFHAVLARRALRHLQYYYLKEEACLSDRIHGILASLL